MYRIVNSKGVELGIIERVNYINYSSSGSYTLVDEDKAIGIALDGVAYNLLGHDEIDGADTVSVSWVDGGTVNVPDPVMDEIISYSINAIKVTDTTALRWKKYYPKWETLLQESPNELIKVDFIVQYKDKLYKCRQAHEPQVNREPDVAASLWAVIDEQHAGTVDDPIPYDGNMALENGKYYSQDGVTYHCTRDTGNPVYNALKDLIGLYVEVVE